AFTWTGFYFGVNAGYGWAARPGKYASALTVDPRRCKLPPAAPADSASTGDASAGGDEAPEDPSSGAGPDGAAGAGSGGAAGAGPECTPLAGPQGGSGAAA